LLQKPLDQSEWFPAVVARYWLARGTKFHLGALSGRGAFYIAVLIIEGWAMRCWQLIINTSTTIVTFLMVFNHSKHPKPCWSRHSGKI
jgi:hypothetical protein